MSLLSAEWPQLDQVFRHFSFTNKAADNQLKRLKRTIFFKERQFLGESPESFEDWKRRALAEAQAKVKVHCCEWVDGDLIIPTGLIVALEEYCKKKGWPLEKVEGRDFELARRLLNGQKPRALRAPQIEGLAALREHKETGVGLLRIATGCGKTMLAQEWIREVGCRSIFLVPSTSILKQTVKRFEKSFGAKNVKTFGDGKKNVGYVTVATYQSVYKADAEDFDEIGMAIMDEVHHVGAETFFDVAVNKLRNAVYRYGLTAYEERADGGTMLVEAAVGPVIYSYDAVRGIAEGYLAKPTFLIYDMYQTEGEWTRYKIKGKVRTAVETVTSKVYDGDDHLEAYRHWVLGNDILNHKVAAMVAEFNSNGLSVLILVDEIEHGNKLKALIPDAGYCIGGGKDNERFQELFNKREMKNLIGTSTLSEGADTIAVDVLINLQGGASVSQTKQADGRALRNEEDENGVAQKPNTLIIDFNFPLCEILTRHSGIREKVHAEMGEVQHDRLD